MLLSTKQVLCYPKTLDSAIQIHHIKSVPWARFYETSRLSEKRELVMSFLVDSELCSFADGHYCWRRWTRASPQPDESLVGSKLHTSFWEHNRLSSLPWWPMKQVSLCTILLQRLALACCMSLVFAGKTQGMLWYRGSSSSSLSHAQEYSTASDEGVF